MLDLFSGIGGFSVAARWTGQIETVAFCEIEPYPQKVLRKNFPGVPIFEDVRTLKGDDVGTVDIICGGYPCQPFSLAGKRAGEQDDRHLWPEVRRLLQESRPTWGLFENVVGHISMGLDNVLSDLEGIGYAGQALVVPACAKNAPHRRDRVWILAHTAGGSEQPRSAQCNVRRLQDKILRDGRDTNHFAVEPRADRVADGIPARVDRIRCLGNAIVPQVAYEFFMAMLAAHRECLAS